MTVTISRPGTRGNPPGRHGQRRWPQYETMPWPFTAALRELSGDRLNVALLWATEAGWTPSALALALNVTRQQVSRRAATARYRPSATTIAIPEVEDSR